MVHSRRTRKIALSLYHSGLSSREVTQCLSDEFEAEVSPQTVARWARAIGMNRAVGGKRFVVSGEDLRPLYDAGASVSQLSQHYHVSEALVWERLRDAGTQMRPSGTVYTLLTPGLLQEMYWEQGMTTKQIARRVGCSQATVHYRLRAYGIPRKRLRRKGRVRGDPHPAKLVRSE